MPDADLTLIANVALDRVNDGPWTCGGCPVFAAEAFRRLGARGVIHAACAERDRATFCELETDDAVTVRFVEAARTTSFDLRYSGAYGESRAMVVHAIGHEWSAADVDRLEITSEWVHLAPLMRSDFPVATVARLAELGHRISYDGQGLVRAPQTGEMVLDAGFDRELLQFLTALKISDDEAAVLADGDRHELLLDELSVVPELVVTHGFRGAELRLNGSVRRVAPEQVVSDVQTTGAGDAFMTGYGVGRGRGLAPADAAALGAGVASEMLAERKSAAVSHTLPQ